MVWISIFHWADRGPRIRTAIGNTVRRFADGAGPTFVKMGQVLSSRPDILPTEIIRELSVLQDQVSALPFAEITRIVETNLGRPVPEVYRQLDPAPLAAASVAQVHVGVLMDGTKVAVKVQRPGLAARFANDLVLLRLVAKVVSLVPNVRALQPLVLVDEFGAALRSQLDFKAERENARYFAEVLADFDWVRLPRMYEKFSGPQLITMEFIEGEKASAYIARRQKPAAHLARRIFQLYVRMAMDLQVLHADMHPGNLLIDSKDRLVILDTGLIHRVENEYLTKQLQSLLSFAAFRGDLLVQAYVGDRPDVSQAVRKEIADSLQSQMNMLRERDIATIDISELWGTSLRLMREHQVYLDRELTLIIISDITFSGMARQFDPNFDYIGFFQTEMPRLVFEKKKLPANDPFLKAALEGAAQANKSPAQSA